jgi:ABC-type multidrug transport system fused ATPase/permease subunit
LTGHSIAEATAAANRIIDIRPSLEDRRKKPDIPKGGRPASIHFHDVHFKYPGRDIPVLRGVNIKVYLGHFHTR